MIACEAVPCNQCGGTRTIPIAHGPDREYYTSRDVFWVVRCKSCGLVYLNPRPKAAELHRIYPRRYHAYVAGESRARSSAALHRFRRVVLRHLHGQQPIRMLDVGCGNGWQLDIARKVCGRRIDPYGIDIDRAACDRARAAGNFVECARFEDVDYQSTRFDLITLIHVLEHLADPQAAVRKAAALLRPGGVMVIETPNIGAWEYRFLNRDWGAYHIPRHWWFYDRRSIAALGTDAGFRMIDWYCHPAPTHWVWSMHNLATRWNNRVGLWLEELFDPVQIFRGGLKANAALGFFYLLDRLALLLGRETSVMTAVFKKTDEAKA